ncbi:MAG: adenosylcobinamide-GDP ribazoletransferase [Chloroflexaceae bacterium]|nr:adenosylcobinamide-GDP ribazoletransferase [Chloroflexaceae bacterium]
MSISAGLQYSRPCSPTCLEGAIPLVSSEPDTAAAPSCQTVLAAPGEAIRFLTIIPVPGLPPTSEQSIARSVAWFPAVGVLIGVLLWLAGWLAQLLWGLPVAAILVVIVWAILTAGLHLDGLSDTFDGVMSWRPRERKLAIMRDSRVGVMGVLALIAIVLLKAAWLSAAAPHWWAVLLLAPTWGRWAMVSTMVLFPTARASGLGHTFRSRLGLSDVLFASSFPLLLALLTNPWQGLLAGLLVAAVTHLLAWWWTVMLGGLTGDTYGAICEIGEAVALAVLTV